MKVALLLTGGVRVFEDTFYSIEHHIIKRFSDVDVFIYGVENRFGREYNTKRLKELYNPKKIVINEKKYYVDNPIIDTSKVDSRFSSVVSALYNVKKANELKKQYQLDNNIEYDLVIRARMDHFWIRSLSDDEIMLSSSNIVVPRDFSFKCVNSFALGDIYCITNDTDFEFYSLAYDHYLDYIDIFPFHPESVLGYYLRERNIVECHRHINTEYPLVGSWNPPQFNAFNTFDIKGNQIYPIVSQVCGEKDMTEIPLEFYSPKVWRYPEDFPDYFGDPVELRRRYE